MNHLCPNCGLVGLTPAQEFGWKVVCAAMVAFGARWCGTLWQGSYVASWAVGSETRSIGDVRNVDRCCDSLRCFSRGYEFVFSGSCENTATEAGSR
jgi:hypothetical protein